MPEVTITTQGVEVTVTHDADVVTSATIRTSDPSGLAEVPTMDLSWFAAMYRAVVVRANGNGNGHVAPGKGGAHRRGRRARAAEVEAVSAMPATPPPPPPPAHLEENTADVQERAYRVLTPELREQILKAYADNPNTTVSGLAREVLDVPRHTANQWVNRMRREGDLRATE